MQFELTATTAAVADVACNTQHHQTAAANSSDEIVEPAHDVVADGSNAERAEVDSGSSQRNKADIKLPLR